MYLAQLLATTLSVAGFVAAAPQILSDQGGPPGNCPQNICIDGMNPACPSVRWGGCYDACQPAQKPTMPPCPKPVKPTKSITKITGIPSPRPTSPPTSPPKSSSSGSCSTRTVCVDYVDECGQWYGGCHNDCRPWPSYSKPPCPSTTSITSITTTEADQTYSLPYFTPEPEQTYSLPYFPA